MIGSSNITRYALLKNIEWDVSVQDDDVYKQAMSEFDDKWQATHLLNPEIIKDFLTKGSSSEIQEFVQGYLGGMSKALESRMFRDYVVLHIRFTTIMYLESIGVEKEGYTERIEGKYQDTSIKASQVAGYCVDILQSAIDIRDEKNESQATAPCGKCWIILMRITIKRPFP